MAMDNKICETCGKEFKPKKSTLKYCSRVCYEEKRARKENKCKVCWKLFIWSRKTQQYCSKECRMKDVSLEIVSKKCPTCWKEFNTKDINKIYCCIKCRNCQEKICEICWKSFITNSYNQKACSCCTTALEKRRRNKPRVYICKYCWKKFKWAYQNTTCKECIKKLSSTQAVKMKEHYIQLSDNDKQKRNNKIRNSVKKMINNVEKWKWIEWQKKKSASLKKYYENMTEQEYKEYHDNLVKKAGERYKKTWYMRPVQQPEVISSIKSKSKEEDRRRELLIKVGFDVEPQFSLGKYRYDLKVWQTLLEINPFPFHNSTRVPPKTNAKPKHKMYHYNKTKYAMNNWYNIINVWDRMNLDEVISLLNKQTYINKEPTLHRYNPRTKEHIIDDWFLVVDMLDKGFIEIRDWWEFYSINNKWNG